MLNLYQCQRIFNHFTILFIIAKNSILIYNHFIPIKGWINMNTYKPRPKELATEYLESYILENNLKAHDRLPPERELSQMWNLNRVTLRSAIASMEAAGRLYSVQGRGTMVAPRFVRTLQNLESFTKYASHYEAKSETRLLSAPSTARSPRRRRTGSRPSSTTTSASPPLTRSRTSSPRPESSSSEPPTATSPGADPSGCASWTAFRS